LSITNMGKAADLAAHREFAGAEPVMRGKRI
jgi:hypothetical protein